MQQSAAAIHVPIVIRILITWVVYAARAVQAVLEADGSPTIIEAAVFAALGIGFGFLLLAWSMKAVLTLFVIGLGMAWGMVLGLLLERVRTQTVRA